MEMHRVSPVVICSPLTIDLIRLYYSGGSQMLTEAMHNSLPTKATFKTKVTVLAESDLGMDVTTEDETGKLSLQEYSAVISTVPLPRLSVMDLTGCTLTYAQWSAIRQLRYGPSIKVSLPSFRE